MSKLLILESCNFKDYPTGGTLSFAKQLIQTLPSNKIALVGITTENIELGKWTTINLEDQTFDFFPILKLDPKNKKPFIPLRLKTFFALLYYLTKIRHKPNRIVFTQTPQFIFALVLFKWISISFCFAGLGNSIKLSRYRGLRFLGGIYETTLLILLSKFADCIFAAADIKSIQDFKKKHKAIFNKEIVSLPTRFDNNIFYPSDKTTSRKKLGLPENLTILVTTGRLCWIKGWEFLLDVLQKRIQNNNNTLLIFVGDGEDRKQIEEKHSELFGTHILITGFVEPQTVAEYINSSDVFILGSYTEGWSTSLVEALACGKPIVTTDVSSASDIVRDGITGFIVEQRNPILFNDYIDKALCLKNIKQITEGMALKYSKSSLYKDFINNWQTVKNYFNETITN